MTTQNTPRPLVSPTRRQRRDDPPVVPLRTVEVLLRDHPRLHLYGYGTPRGLTSEPIAGRQELLTPSSRVGMAAALTWIETRLIPAPRNSKRARSTYSLKHVMERETGAYLYNGIFASAALLSHISVDTSYYNPLCFATLNPDTTPKGDDNRGTATA